MIYAIILKDKVENIFIAEEGLPEELSNAIAKTEVTGSPWIGARWNGKKFEPEKIYPSWIWNEKTFDYDPPKPKPDNHHVWDETILSWVVSLEK